MAPNPLPEKVGPPAFPDPIFKLVTRQQAEFLGLQPLDSEIQFTTRADLVLVVHRSKFGKHPFRFFSG